MPISETPIAGLPYEDARRDFRAALLELDEWLEEEGERRNQMRDRIRQLQQALDQGRPISEVLPENGPPPLAAQISELLEMWLDAGARLRRTEARVLYEEGLTMDRIAELFGVSRQRISALLSGT